ncbi:hypothetical protein [Agromyces salentinus]|uniref:hypothetical protein n=1 Tax=Agromyces salentinus TaxID=269421 RepID=UPI0012FCA2CF|nr:hypothetical protein [Agromyces salentinus]
MTGIGRLGVLSQRPGGTAAWGEVLAHRGDPEVIAVVRQRFIDHDVTADSVVAALDDGGDRIFADATSGRADWAVAHGGAAAAALLASEVAAYASYLTSRAASVRSLAVDELLEERSAVEVASELGISRQKIYEIARGASKVRDAFTSEAR